MGSNLKIIFERSLQLTPKLIVGKPTDSSPGTGCLDAVKRVWTEIPLQSTCPGYHHVQLDSFFQEKNDESNSYFMKFPLGPWMFSPKCMMGRKTLS